MLRYNPILRKGNMIPHPRCMFYVKVTPRQSKDLQLYAFQHGYKWDAVPIPVSTEVSQTEYAYLQFWTDLSITYSGYCTDDTELNITEAKCRIKGV